MTKKATFDYKQASERLDEVVAAMQAPDISVDQAIAHYEEGMQLVSQIETYLQEAEHKIKKVST